jgi:DNA-binding XRE family transcriptional regulator
VDLEQAFRCRVRQHRQAAGMTQEPLAEPVRISTKTIERGVVASPFDAVERIASALQRSPLPSSEPAMRLCRRASVAACSHGYKQPWPK